MTGDLRAELDNGEILTIPRQIKTYQVINIIGTGICGAVVTMRESGAKDIFAGKVIHRPVASTDKMRTLERELRLSVTVSCPYLVRCLDVIYLDELIVMVMEFIEGENLVTAMKKNAPLIKQSWKKIMTQICMAMQYLHKRGLAHRDVKLDNMLVDKDLNLKLCDYGVICEVTPGSMMTTMCGTVPYMAPEILRDKGYFAQPADVWAVGISLYAIVSGVFPWSCWNVPVMSKQILKGEINVGNLPEDVREVVERCCDMNPMTRATIEEILAMQVMKSTLESRTETNIAGKVLPNLGMYRSERCMIIPHVLVPRVVQRSTVVGTRRQSMVMAQTPDRRYVMNRRMSQC